MRPPSPTHSSSSLAFPPVQSQEDAHKHLRLVMFAMEQMTLECVRRDETHVGFSPPFRRAQNSPVFMWAHRYAKWYEEVNGAKQEIATTLQGSATHVDKVAAEIRLQRQSTRDALQKLRSDFTEMKLRREGALLRRWAGGVAEVRAFLPLSPRNGRYEIQIEKLEQNIVAVKKNAAHQVEDLKAENRVLHELLDTLLSK